MFLFLLKTSPVSKDKTLKQEVILCYRHLGLPLTKNNLPQDIRKTCIYIQNLHKYVLGKKIKMPKKDRDFYAWAEFNIRQIKVKIGLVP